MDVISVFNRKGGIGKTTIAANVAASLAKQGRKVLLIDLDPQISLTSCFVRPEDWRKDLKDRKDIKKWLDSIASGERAFLDRMIHFPSKVRERLMSYRNSGKLHLISSHVDLDEVNDKLTKMLPDDIGDDAGRYIQVLSLLKNGLQSFHENLVDVAVIDCPPDFNILTQNAIVASDFLLVPIKPDDLSLQGFPNLVRSLNKLETNYNHYGEGIIDEEMAPDIMVVFTMVQLNRGTPINLQKKHIRRAELEIRNNVRRNIGREAAILEDYLCQNNIVFSDAPSARLPIVLQSPTTKSEDIVGRVENIVAEITAIVFESEK